MDLKTLKDKIEKYDNRIYENEFFEMLKESSLITFRNNINYIQSIKPTLFLEDKVTKYYESLLNEFNPKTSLFGIYNDFLEMIECNFDDFFYNYNDYNYIITNDVIEDIKEKLNSKNKLEDCYKFLVKTTNEKISEIVIDALFKDTIYNVHINIKEMLRYNNSLTEDEKVLTAAQIDFYKTILDFDNVISKDKIKLYNKLKDKNINLMFYNDLRKLKDLLYKKINQSMIKLIEHPEFKSEELSSKFDLEVYDLRDKNYVMLVSCANKYSDKTNNIFGCYTLLSDKNTAHYTDYTESEFLYGYCSFPLDHIMHIFEEDAGAKQIEFDDSLNIGSRKVNRLMTPEEIIMNGNGYSEINLKNKIINNMTDKRIKNYDRKKEMVDIFNLMKPDFIVAVDNIEEKQIEESKRLNIPIVIIKEKLLDNDKGNISYDYNLDDYTIFNFEGLENNRKSSR